MKKLLITVFLSLFVIAATLEILGVLPGGNGILAETALADGSEVRVLQRYSKEDFGYTIDFYFRPPDGAWGWCYLGHEDTKWRNARIDHDPESGTVSVWRSSTLRGRWSPGNSTWERPGVDNWITKAPQKMEDPPL